VPLRSVRVMLGTISATNAPMVLAQHAGFNARHGLDVELIPARSAAEGMAAVLSRDAPFGAVGGSAVVNARAGGADVVALALQQSRLTQQLAVSPDVRSVTDLKGKRVAVADTGGSTDLAATVILERAGLRRGEDVAILALGSPTERLGGLQAGGVQGAMLTEPFAAAARKAGFPVLYNMAELDYELPSSAVLSTEGYLAGQPEVARALIAALVDGIHYIKTERAGTIAIFGQFLQQDDPEVLDAIYSETSGAAMPEVPWPSVKAFANGLQQVAGQNPAVLNLRAEELVDDRYVRELVESGYVDRLYGR
jgi:ABC-type nitrate/sulfonate/bicarbonate transport system substrate-binding protein